MRRSGRRGGRKAGQVCKPPKRTYQPAAWTEEMIFFCYVSLCYNVGNKIGFGHLSAFFRRGEQAARQACWKRRWTKETIRFFPKPPTPRGYDAWVAREFRRVRAQRLFPVKSEDECSITAFEEAYMREAKTSRGFLYIPPPNSASPSLSVGSRSPSPPAPISPTTMTSPALPTPTPIEPPFAPSPPDPVLPCSDPGSRRSRPSSSASPSSSDSSQLSSPPSSSSSVAAATAAAWGNLTLYRPPPPLDAFERELADVRGRLARFRHT